MENHGYFIIKPENEQDAMSNGFRYEHIEVAEKKLGRKLRAGEVVHHLDENKKNNSPDNLIVFATNAEHTAYHKGNKKIYFDSEGIAHVDIGNRCIICGAKIVSGASLCKDCYSKQRRRRIPTETELRELLEKYSFVEIGNTFGVSERAVRKWCVSYGMPTQRKFYTK